MQRLGAKCWLTNTSPLGWPTASMLSRARSATKAALHTTGIIPLANTHLATWDETSAERRRRRRAALGLQHCTVVLNVCRFHLGERAYKGLDIYSELLSDLRWLRPDLKDQVVFVLCGKGTEVDVEEMEACGLRVFANVTDAEMVELYLAADLYMNFSRWEGYNLGIAQALAFGLPIVASDITAHREFPITISDDPDEIIEPRGRAGRRSGSDMSGKSSAGRLSLIGRSR